MPSFRNRFGLLVAAGLSAPAIAKEPALGQEGPFTAAEAAEEAVAIATITRLISEQVTAEFKRTGFARRDAHAKHHGCVEATFTVEPNLAATHPNLAVGVFAVARSHPAYLRLSNGAGKLADDRDGDARGMAIKLLDVPGDKLLPDESGTQDFLMINHPVFFVRNPTDYVEFIAAISKGSPREFFLKLGLPPTLRIHELRIANAIRSKKVTNPLAVEYFSTTPILLGTQAVKFKVTPVEGQTFVTPPPSADQLRSAMSEQLARGEVRYAFEVQLQTDPRRTPIEDPTVAWSTRESPFIKVAELRIPRDEHGAFLSAERMDLCEQLSYSPWHAVVAHRPLGGMQRVRKVVYQTISTLRHELNHKAQVEPKP